MRWNESESMVGVDTRSEGLIRSAGIRGQSDISGPSNRRDFIIQTLGVTATLFSLGACGKIDPDASAGALTKGDQPDWRYCGKCAGMFFDGYTDKGRCPADGGHSAIGYNFVLPYDVPFDAPGNEHRQAQWRYCGKCHAIFYDGYADKGRCPNGGGHSAIGYNFVLPHDVSASETAQPFWRYCGKCHVMFYDGYNNKGQCPGGGGHSSIGFYFVLPHRKEARANPTPPPPSKPKNPNISVSYDRAGQTFKVSGKDFLPNHIVHVRVVNNADVQALAFFDTTSHNDGAFENYPISFPINTPQTYSFSANDARSDPSDRTGTLWSNTATITAT